MTKLKIALAVASATAVAGCGSGMDHSSHMSGDHSQMNGNQTQSGMGAAKMSDPMFTAEMIPHHQAAIDMAALAPTRAEHPEIKTLAAEIGSAQAAEIELMKKVGKENGWDPNAKMDHSGMSGMSKHEMGMDMDPAELKTAKPFDKAFIEMMVPHHEGAILMANHELSRGSDPQIRALAKRIIASQSVQIKQMKQWYQAWYGSPLS
jgi:uncharacterized protein (DUF305 family)